MAPNRKNIQLKLISYDMKGYDSVKIVKNMEDIATHNKTYEAVVFLCKKAQNAIHNKNMDLAEKLLKEVYVKLKKVRAKHPISVDEFVGYLRKESVLMKFTGKMSSVADSVSKVMKYEGVITKSVTAIQRLKELYSKDQIVEEDKSAINANISQLKKDRNELKEGYKKMRVVMSFIKIANEFLPPGADTFTDLSFTAFEEAGKTIDKIDKHTEKIEAAVKRDMGKLQEEIGSNSESLKTKDVLRNDDKFSKKSYDINSELDRKYGNPSTKHHKKKRY